MSTITFVWYWLREQCRPHKVAFPLDMALFASSLSVIVLPYYLWRFERWPGILKVLALAGSAAAAELWSAIVHFILVVGK